MIALAATAAATHAPASWSEARCLTTITLPSWSHEISPSAHDRRPRAPGEVAQPVARELLVGRVADLAASGTPQHRGDRGERERRAEERAGHVEAADREHDAEHEPGDLLGDDAERPRAGSAGSRAARRARPTGSATARRASSVAAAAHGTSSTPIIAASRLRASAPTTATASASSTEPPQPAPHAAAGVRVAGGDRAAHLARDRRLQRVAGHREDQERRDERAERAVARTARARA